MILMIDGKNREGKRVIPLPLLPRLRYTQRHEKNRMDITDADRFRLDSRPLFCTGL